MKIDQGYWQGSKVFPPYDLGFQGVSNGGPGPKGSVSERFAGFDWTPYTVGTAEQQENDVGDHDDIGILNASVAADFWCKSPIKPD